MTTCSCTVQDLCRAQDSLVFGGWLDGSEEVPSESGWLALSVAEAEAEIRDAEFAALEAILASIDERGRVEPPPEQVAHVLAALQLLGWVREVEEDEDLEGEE